MIFLLYTGTSALIIYISNIQGTKKYSAVMYYVITITTIIVTIIATVYEGTFWEGRASFPPYDVLSQKSSLICVQL